MIEGHINWTNSTQDFKTTGSVTGSSLVFDFDTQDYLFTDISETALAVQGQTAATACSLSLMAADGDGTDNIAFNIFGIGTPASLDPMESCTLQYIAGGPNFVLYTATTNGTVRPLSIYTGAHTTQLVLDISGNIGMAGVVTMGAALVPQIGFGADVDLLELAANALTVNGTITAGGTIFAPAKIEHVGDSDTYMNFTNNVVEFVVAGKHHIRMSGTSVVVNEEGLDIDFRVEGDNDTDLIRTDAATDKVGIGASVPSSKLQVAGAISSATTTITASSDTTDVSGVNAVFINITGDIVLGGLIGGVEGQVVNFAIIGNFTNHVRFEHAEGVGGSQDFINHTGLDEDIDNGGCAYVCNGTNWYDISHAKHT